MEISNEIGNEINNNIKIEENNFLKEIIGKTVNNAIDIGLKTILPDVIENQIIDIKDALIENGLKSGIDTAINSVVDFWKSTKGIFSGKFENMSQINIAIGEGGIVDTISDLLDKTINKINYKGYINDTIAELIKGSKNIILDNIESSIKNEINEQENLLQKLDQSIKSWEACYQKKDFEGMTEAYNKINTYLKKCVPIENILENANKVNNIHNLIQNNGQNFNISNYEIELVQNLQI